jgi:AraC-like DNA-binding protein
MKRLGIEGPHHWHPTPPPNTPEFKPYFENIVNSSQSITEAVERLGYTRPQSVRYNLKRFGIKAPDNRFSHRDIRPSTRDPRFRTYFENIIKASGSLKEAMERLGYAGPTSVYYHMRKLGIQGPEHWYGHPSTYGPEFAAHFENVVRTSKTVDEAAHRLGYANRSMIYHHLLRLGIRTPSRWRLKPGVSRQRRALVPHVIIQTERERVRVATLHQGEGCLLVHYLKRSDETSLQLRIGMTDPAPIFRFCDSCGVSRPKRSTPKDPPWKPMWLGVVDGLRAYRVVQEILPFLEGEKLMEAKRALEFFAPDGRRKGRYGAYDVWPANQFLLRKRSLASYVRMMMAKNADLSFSYSSRNPTLRLDRTCLRIADVLLDIIPEGLGLADIMDRSGASWTAVIHHLKHLEYNSLVTRERIQQKVGPRLLFRALHRLVEVRELGWVPDSLA